MEGQFKYMNILPSDYSKYIDYSEYQIWYQTFFNDKVFFEKYLHALEEVSDDRFLDKFFGETEKGFDEKIRILYKSYPGYRFKHRDILYENQKIIKKIIDPVEAVQAYFVRHDDKNNKIVLEVGNIQSLPVEIIGIGLDNISVKSDPKSNILNPKKLFSFIDFRKLSFEFPTNINLDENKIKNIYLNYRVYGSKTTKKTPIYPWAHYDVDFAETDVMRRKPNFHEFPFLIVNSNKQAIIVKSGEWVVNKDLIIPKGYKVFCGPSTKIVLKNTLDLMGVSAPEKM
jgi:hypothetical protein